MTTYNVFANGTLWGAYAAGSAEEAVQMAANEHGTVDVGKDCASTEGMTAEKAWTDADLETAAPLMDGEIREEMHDEGFDSPDAFLREYMIRHEGKHGERFAWA